MHYFNHLLIAVLLLTAGVVNAQTLKNIELQDGSSIRAEVRSMNDGQYTVYSPTLGEIKIPESDVRSIGEPQRAASAARVGSTQIDSIRQSIVNDPAAMKKIEGLQNDPIVKDILSDEQTMRAISAGNLDALMKDPKIKALMEHSTVKELTRSATP